ncbi:MAG: hypothetical protein ABWZ77_01450 [Naasia sp.]
MVSPHIPVSRAARPASDPGSGRWERSALRSRVALTAAALLLAAGAAGCSSVPAQSVPESSPTAVSTPASAADICARAGQLVDDGAPREALEIIAALRDGAPTPAPTVTRRTLTPPTPVVTATPTPDCEEQRLAAIDALGTRLAPTAAPVPSAAQSFRSDWDAVTDRWIAPFVPALQVVVGGILLLLVLAAALALGARRSGSTSARALRRVGLAMVLVAPVLFAALLPAGSLVLSLLVVALGIGGAVLLSRHDPARGEVELEVIDETTGSADTAASIDAVGRVRALVEEGYGPLERLDAEEAERLSPETAGASEGPSATVGAIVLVPALGPRPGPLSRILRRLRRGSVHPTLSLLRGDGRSAVVHHDGEDRRVAVAVDAARLTADAEGAGVAMNAAGSTRLAAEGEAAAVLAVLTAASGGEPADAGRIRSIVLQRLADDIGRASEPSARGALLEAAAAADPRDLRVAAIVDARRHRASLDPEQLAGFLARTQASIDSALLVGAEPHPEHDWIAEPATLETAPSPSETARPGWRVWVRDQLLTATATALDLRALTGIPADARVELDARRLVRIVADASDASNGPGAHGSMPDHAQMLTGVYFCELFPAERGSGSAVSRWADAALVSTAPDIAYAVACSFSSGWRDDMAPHLKIEIERRIVDRLRWALPEPGLRERAAVDPVLRRHAEHPWYRDLLASSAPAGDPS